MFLNNFVIRGPAHPPSPFSFAVLQHDKDYGGQANAPTFAGLWRGKRIIGMTKLSIEEEDHEFEGASHPRSSFGVRRCSAAFEKPSQIENRCSPALIWSLLSHARPCNALAARAKASSFGKWRLFRYSGYLSQGSVFSDTAASRGFAARPSHRRARLFVGTRSMGCVFESLSICCSFPERLCGRNQPLANVRRTSHADRRLDQPTRQDSRTKGLA